MPRPKKPHPGLPDRQAILDFIATQKSSVGKREIAKAFGLHSADKIALKALLKEMMEAGELEGGPGRTVHKGGGLPKVTVIRVCDVADGVALLGGRGGDFVNDAGHAAHAAHDFGHGLACLAHEARAIFHALDR